MKIPFHVSRMAIGVLGVATVGLTGLYTYSRAIDANPLRLMKDADDNLRWMTKLEAIEVQLSKAQERAAHQPNDTKAKMIVDTWEKAYAKEQDRVKATGEGKEKVTDDDLTLK